MVGKVEELVVGGKGRFKGWRRVRGGGKGDG